MDNYHLKSFGGMQQYHNIEMKEENFATPTQVYHALPQIQPVVDMFQPDIGRVHFLKLDAGGYFPPHVDFVGACPESNDSLAAVILSRILNRYLWILLDRCCRDLASGFVLASRDIVNKVGLRGSYGDYCIRFLYGAHRLGHELHEVPYVCLVRRHGVSKTGTTLAQLLKRGLPYLTTPLRVRREFASR